MLVLTRRAILEFEAHAPEQLVGVPMRLGWNVTVAKSENADVDICLAYIRKTLFHRALISGDGILHRDDVVATFLQSLLNDLCDIPSAVRRWRKDKIVVIANVVS